MTSCTDLGLDGRRTSHDGLPAIRSTEHPKSRIAGPPRLARATLPRTSFEMRAAWMILLLADGVADAKKNKADRKLEQALAKESASDIDAAIEMGAVSQTPAAGQLWLASEAPAA